MRICDTTCPHRDIPQTRILIIHLEAIGAVVRSTALLKPIKRKFPSSHITWITKSPSDQLLNGHPAIDRVLTLSNDDLLSLKALSFDVAFVIDKSLTATGILNHTQVDYIYGFRSDPSTGAIVPATMAAEELWKIGLDDNLKFFINIKTENQLVAEALELDYQKDAYWLYLSPHEQSEVLKRKKLWAHDQTIIGINTGCSHVIPHKKLTVEAHRNLIIKLKSRYPNSQIVLLGGREDSERNELIAKGLSVITSPTNNGLRDGFISVSACDVVITGDSLGMHLSLAAQKPTIAWFGPTCAHEIELYGNGVAILSQATCGPCWKRTCNKAVMCYDQVNLDSIVNAIGQYLPNLNTSHLIEL